jgi:hypothetical protein
MSKRQICYTEMIYLLLFNLYVQCTLQILSEIRVLLESAFTFLYAASSIQIANEQFLSCIHLSLCCQQHPNCERAVPLVYPPFFMLPAASKLRTSSSCRVSTFLYAASSIQIANEQFLSCIHLSLASFTPHPTAQTKKERSWFCVFKQLYLGHNPECDTCSYELVFPESPLISSRSQSRM